LPDTLDEVTSTETVRFQTGRFVTQPVARTNLHGDLVRFLSEVLAVEDPSSLHHLAQSLTINVLDAHLDATYWQGRQAGHGQHYKDTRVSVLDARLDENNHLTGAAS
jgi:hypothetical protein